MSKSKKTTIENESDFNLIKLTPRKLIDVLVASAQFGGAVAIFGMRGGGKTTICQAVSNEVLIKKNGELKKPICKYLNVSTLERPDLGGYPNFLDASSDNKDYVSFKMPYFYRELIEGDTPVIVILDEIDKADSSLIAPLLEFVQFHSINGRPLPNLQAIFMTGNLTAEGGVRPSLPLLDRTEKYILSSSVEEWLDWACHSGRIHPSVTAYIQDNANTPGALHGPVDIGEDYGSTSPRGWENASKHIQFCEDNNISPEIANLKVRGCVGKEAGIKFATYHDWYCKYLPIVDEVIKTGTASQKISVLPASQQLVILMAIFSRASLALDANKNKSKQTKEMKNIGKFLTNNKIDNEIFLVSFRSQIGHQRIIDNRLLDVPELDALISNILKRLECK